MSDKRKFKQKRKRGYSQARLDFISPLTPEECIEHLKAGRTPFSMLSLEVDSEENRFTVFPRDRYSLISYSAFWIEGEFAHHPAGTRVQGGVHWQDNGVFSLLFVLLGSLLLAGITWVALLLVTGEMSLKECQTSIFICNFFPLLGMGVLFLVRDELRQRNQTLLLEWIDERLNVRRDKR